MLNARKVDIISEELREIKLTGTENKMKKNYALMELRTDKNVMVFNLLLL